MTSPPNLVVGLGEVLWDLLPGGPQLGGAPANFACAASQLGDRGALASRVGADERGGEALRRMERLGLDTAFVQTDEAHPTGTVTVGVDVEGQPSFRIDEEVAWDFLAWTPRWEELAARADAVCFGTLAQRSPRSRETVRRFLGAMRPEALRVFDVNLRQTFYTEEVLTESLNLAHVVKLNDEELPRVAELLGLGGRGLRAWANRLIQVFDLNLVCVTRGARGSLLVTESEMSEHPATPVEVRDTVGAGDAFTAALVHHYLRGRDLETIGAAANRLGAWVATRAGATPAIPDEIRREVTLS